FFYLNESWSPSELKIFEQGNTLAKVIEADTDITNLQSDVFLFTASISGTVVSDQGHATDWWSSSRGVADVTVELEDSNGSALATTTTDGEGHYSFDQLNAVSATGDYMVRLIAPSGFKQASANPSTILISRGDISVRGVNFAIVRAN
ncbi:MAG TPA: SdrD B-like domain-containing protein, partial [Isosphaeraceae bacterium]|nr:SdrD B-like domain-containing protein [Isosphaeraceae bacterium]